MRTSVAVRAAFMLTTVALGFTPAQATRTVIDSGTNMTTSGYCSPNGGCFPYALSPSLQLSGGPYSSYYINSNGVASFGSISGFLAAENVAGAVGQTSLSAFNVPLFSPYFSDGAGFQTQNAFDGNLVASTSSTGSGFIVNWYSCTSPIACGSRTIDLIASQTYSANPINPLLQNNIIAASTRPDKATASPEQNFLSGQAALIAFYTATLPIYTMQLTELAGGLQVDYRYSGLATGATGTYGFVLPGASLQQTGTLANRTYLFNSLGELVGSVPEPSTWMMMLMGFGLIGVAVRRTQSRYATA